jgi:hypothetical protein
MNSLVMGGLAVVAIIILALALSGTNKSIAVIVQAGLVIAILGVLIRDAGNKNVLFGTTDKNTPFGTSGAIPRLIQMAVGTTGK